MSNQKETSVEPHTAVEHETCVMEAGGILAPEQDKRDFPGEGNAKPQRSNRSVVINLALAFLLNVLVILVLTWAVDGRMDADPLRICLAPFLLVSVITIALSTAMGKLILTKWIPGNPSLVLIIGIWTGAILSILMGLSAFYFIMFGLPGMP